MPVHIPVQNDSEEQRVDVRTPAQKRRETIIRTRFGGDEQAYLDAQRAQASRGGKNGGRPFKDPAKARAAVNKRWEKRKKNEAA